MEKEDKKKSEENWSGQNMFEGQGVRKLRIPLYTYSVWNTCEIQMEMSGRELEKKIGESLSYRFGLN